MIKSRQDALLEIKSLCSKFDINSNDIKNFIENSENKTNPSYTAQYFLSYISGILIFVGACIYIGMIWGVLSTNSKIVITLAPGILAFIISLFCIKNKYKYIAPPLLLISAFLEPLGLYLFFHNYLYIIESLMLTTFIISTIMIAQYFILFQKSKLPTSLFLILLFGCGLFISICSYINIQENIFGVILGLILLLTSYKLNNNNYDNLASIWYFIGSLTLYFAYFDFFKNSNLEFSFILLSALLLYISIYIKNRTLLFTSVFAVIIFLGYYSGKYFANSFGWPIALMGTGILLLIISGLLIKIIKLPK